MMKQLMGIALSAAMVMSIAGSVSAHSTTPITPVNKINVTNQDTYVKTMALSSVTTGGNLQTGGSWLFGGSKLTTGTVSTVGATGQSQVNTTLLPDCNCSKVGDITVSNKDTTVKTRAITTVIAGNNTQTATITHPEMVTGGVNTVYSDSSSSVNYTNFGVVAQ
ncbi:MAG: hypothetical protein WCL07_00080 [bacterium]